MRMSSESDPATKVINFVSVAIAGILGVLTAYTIYTRIMDRAEQQGDGAYIDLELEGGANESDDNALEQDDEGRDSFDIEEDDFEAYQGGFHHKP